MTLGKLLEFDIKGDDRGQLIALEGDKDIPFEIKRVFYIFGTQLDINRGNHAHFETKQFLIAVNGSCKVTLDNGKNKQTYHLDSNDKGLLQDKMIWGVMHDFSEDCVLLVLANDHYKASDYIRNYGDFIMLAQKVNR